MNCRHCGHPLEHSMCDLGLSPLANAYTEDPQTPEMFYPLHARVCSECWLVQVDHVVQPEVIFEDYAYFSSVSGAWVDHCDQFCDWITGHLDLSSTSRVVEIASNDGCLLRPFQQKGMSVLGIDPARNVAIQANENGVPTLCDFFSDDLAGRLPKADLIVANNVLAHVPDINDFVRGLKTLLADGGMISLEFPHLYQLLQRREFDTIYHEHYSYLSVLFVERLLRHHGLRIAYVDSIPTHGGSLRVLAWAESNEDFVGSEILAKELMAGMDKVETYEAFNETVQQTKRDILSELVRLKNEGKRIVGFGAPAKGNTLLNFCGIGRDFIDYVVDETPYKQGRFLPGTKIPVFPLDHLLADDPDYVMILPWNFAEFIQKKIPQFDTMVLIPEVSFHSGLHTTAGRKSTVDGQLSRLARVDSEQWRVESSQSRIESNPIGD